MRAGAGGGGGLGGDAATAAAAVMCEAVARAAVSAKGERGWRI